MRFSKVRPVKSLTRGTKRSAGIDFYVPEFDGRFIGDLNEKNTKFFLEDSHSSSGLSFKRIRLEPHDRILIPSGIKVEVPEGLAFIAFNKSGVSSKKGLDVLACVIDEDYQGEIHLNVVNTSNDTVFIDQNEKLIQCILILISLEEPVEVPIEKLYEKETERGEGGFGHTDHK